MLAGWGGKEFLDSEVANLERELGELRSWSILGSMYKVPRILQDANKENYTPKLIPIGPYHCASENSYASNSLKIRYLKCFLTRTGLDLRTCVEMAQGWAPIARGCYRIPRLSWEDLGRMILLDGIFIVEFTLQCCNGSPLGGDGGLMEASLKADIMRDLTLLENQLPFFVLQGLADHAFPPGNNQGWILNLTKLFIEHFGLMPTSDPNMSYLGQAECLETCSILHLVHFIHIIIFMDTLPTSERFPDPKLEFSRSATELQQAGVKLGCAPDFIFTDIVFKEENGLLQIPHLVVNRHTESFFRNIIAYEHSHNKRTTFRSYVILMDCLVKTSQDVELLVDSGIIQNNLGTSEDVCTLFNNLYKMPMMDINKFLLAGLCQRLNKYSRDPWHKWKATWFRWKLILGRDYFSNPWSIFSVIAACILLGLTIIQTLCSIKGVKW